MKFVPLVNTENIQILTSKNWLDLGVNTLAFSLEALLIKPGLAVLSNQSLAEFLGWKHEIWVIMPKLNEKHILKLRSPFDGATCEYTEEDLNALLVALKPDQIYSSMSPLDEFTISAEPLTTALEGYAYHGKAKLFLQDKQYREQHILLGEECTCPTCKMQLTRAYLHHLYTEVPALCQRYIAMHNITQWKR